MRTILIRCVAVAMILAGLILAGRLAYTLLHQQNHDIAQNKAWQTFVGAAAGQDKPDASPPAGGLYLKLTIPKINKDGIAVNGDWDSLKDASMVHYKDSPAPGAKGNVLVAFHRETHWLDVSNVGTGDMVNVQTADGKTYNYKIDFMRIVVPTDVDLLKPTDGNDITLITCDPPWSDSKRMVFRAHLESS
jgi:LPXTG-site transpeptidase (sortase) family protein